MTQPADNPGGRPAGDRSPDDQDAGAPTSTPPPDSWHFPPGATQPDQAPPGSAPPSQPPASAPTVPPPAGTAPRAGSQPPQASPPHRTPQQSGVPHSPTRTPRRNCSGPLTRLTRPAYPPARSRTWPNGGGACWAG